MHLRQNGSINVKEFFKELAQKKTNMVQLLLRKARRRRKWGKKREKELI